MKKMKKFLAMMLALAMVLGMSVTTFAANSGTPSATDDAELSISGIMESTGVVVKAYRIVEPDYNDNGLYGYHVVNGYTIADNKDYKPTPAEIAVIATTAASKTATYSTENNDFVVTGNATDGFTYTMTATAGEYLVIVESPNYTYNPIVVSAAYGDANNAATLANSTVSAGSNWEVSQTENAFAKSQEVKPEKTVNVPSQEAGGTVNYTITGTIPSYSEEYTNPTYKIVDSYTNLVNQSEPVVTIGGNPATKDTHYTYTQTINAEGTPTGFEINFINVAQYVAATKEARAVVVTYSAVIDSSASTIDPATNTAMINYTNKPGENKDSGEAKTYTHTFDILNQFKKTGEGADAAALPNSKFTLYRADESEFGTYTTVVEDGVASIKFEDLAEGTYTMKETEATPGYSLNNTVYTIVIKDVTYDKTTADKKVTGYTVEITGDDGTDKTYVYTLNEGGNAFVTTNTDVIDVKNTKLSSLPSTGGIGTTIFTIGGCAIMIIAAGLYFSLRRKSAK